MHMCLATEESKKVFMEYAKMFGPFGTLNIKPEITDEFFQKKLKEAMRTGKPVNLDDILMEPLPEGYVL